MITSRIENASQTLKLCPNAKIAVIGAGAAGLIAARNLRDFGSFQVDVIEETDSVGGTWVYNRNSKIYTFESSMYENLCTNLPKEIMGYLAFPFNDRFGYSSFPSHQVVLEYLKSFAHSYHLYERIRFHSLVKQVVPCEKSVYTKWRLSIFDYRTQELENKQYDAIIICNGHYSKPYIPLIPGRETFSHPVIHSHFYKTPREFANLRVVILGAGNSGVDISRELQPIARSVSICHRECHSRKSLTWNLEECPTVKYLGEGGKIYLVDGSILEADVFLLCTGYAYDFSFLHPSCEVFVENRVVSPLYRHLIHAKYPTMAFVGLPYRVLPCPLFDYQTRYLAAVYSGKCSIPSCHLMEQYQIDERQCLAASGREKYYHLFGDKQWEYCRH
eukprot:jgi/Galph1/5894/GphlegSOOS_G4416.1